MKIIIETIPHEEQRYPTVGDWFFDHPRPDKILTIRVSRMGDWRYEVLVAVHELVEVLLCLHKGVSQKSVDKFDMKYEAARKRGDESEPGDDPRAPYKDQHCIATAVERLLAPMLGVSWKKYEQKINSLP
jgi:hypothetical protein